MPLDKRNTGYNIEGFPGLPCVDIDFTADGLDAELYCPGQELLVGSKYGNLLIRRKVKTLKEAILDLDPYFYLPMNGDNLTESLEDHSGNNRDFTAHESVSQAHRLTNDIDDDYSQDGSLHFPDTTPDSYISLSNTTPSIGKFSIIFWTKGDPAVAGTHGIFEFSTSGGTRQFAMYLNGYSGFSSIYVDGSSRASTSPTRSWHATGVQMGAVTVDMAADSIKLYVAGVEREITRTSTISNSSLTIDEFDVGIIFGSNSFSGQLDNVAFFTKVLTADEIEDLFLLGRSEWTNWDVPYLDQFNTPKVLLYCSTNRTHASGGWQTLGLDRTLIDNYSIFDRNGAASSATEGTCTITKLTEGFWRFFTRVEIDNNTDEILTSITLDKNGSGRGNSGDFNFWGTRGQTRGASSDGRAGGLVITPPVYLSEGDTLGVRYYIGNSTGYMDALGGGTVALTWLYGEMISNTIPSTLANYDGGWDTY